MTDGATQNKKLNCFKIIMTLWCVPCCQILMLCALYVCLIQSWQIEYTVPVLIQMPYLLCFLQYFHDWDSHASKYRKASSWVMPIISGTWLNSPSKRNLPGMSGIKPPSPSTTGANPRHKKPSCPTKTIEKESHPLHDWLGSLSWPSWKLYKWLPSQKRFHQECRFQHVLLVLGSELARRQERRTLWHDASMGKFALSFTFRNLAMVWSENKHNNCSSINSNLRYSWSQSFLVEVLTWFSSSPPCHQYYQWHS